MLDYIGRWNLPEGEKLSYTLAIQANLATCYNRLGRDEESIALHRSLYSQRVALRGRTHPDTLVAAHNHLNTLLATGRFDAGKAFLHEIAEDTSALAPGSFMDIKFRSLHGLILVHQNAPSLDDYCKAVGIFEDLNKKLRRVMGANHPETVTNEKYLGDARERLRLRLIGDPSHAEH